MEIRSSSFAQRNRRHPPRRRGFRPQLEALEERCCPTGVVFEWADPTGGALDPTFGSGGQVINSVSNYYDVANAVTTQSDGKIVIAGISWASGSKTGNDFLVARYNVDGSVDTSFGSGGYTVTDFSRARDTPTAVALQPQASGPSKILVAGMTQSVTGNTFNDNFGLARYNANGTLDTSFGSKGKVITDLGGSIDWPDGMLVDGSGRILVVGTTSSVAALVRYTANGALDTTFGAGGKLITNFNLYNGSDAVALQGDGKIVLAGTELDLATSNYEFVIARFNADGTADSGFGTGGVVTTHVGGGEHFGGLAIQGDGRIVIDGSENAGYARALYLLRYNTDGTLDPGFGTGGIATLPSPGGPADGVIDAHGVGPVIQTDGEIIAGGQFDNTTTQQENLAVVRVHPDSSMDVGFGNGGWATIQFAAQGGSVQALALQPDGRVLLAGLARPTSASYPTDVALVRFLASAPQIGSFTGDPNPVLSGSTTTLTASNITDNNPGATVTQVAFYIMIDGSGVLLGYGKKNSDGSWSYAFDTTGYASGTYTLAAQATDSYGVFGNPVALTLTIE
jgi:uncharacterized delta-60 repeat protein